MCRTYMLYYNQCVNKGQLVIYLFICRVCSVKYVLTVDTNVLYNKN